MNTIRKINFPIRFFGLAPIYVVVMAVLLALFIIGSILMRLHPLVLLCFIVGYILTLSFLLRRSIQEHKLGNPDYFQGLMISRSTPRKIVDKSHVFHHLIS